MQNQYLQKLRILAQEVSEGQIRYANQYLQKLRILVQEVSEGQNTLCKPISPKTTHSGSGGKWTTKSIWKSVYQKIYALWLRTLTKDKMRYANQYL